MPHPNPLMEYLDQLFRSDRGWLPKLLAAGAFGIAIAALIVWKNHDTFSLTAQLVTLIAVPLTVIVGAAALLQADKVRRRLKTGRRVGVISRIAFGAGVWSFLIWIIIALLIGFPTAIWLGTMTSGVPPR
jgi:hypothetical protein